MTEYKSIQLEIKMTKLNFKIWISIMIKNHHRLQAIDQEVLNLIDRLQKQGRYT